MNSPVRDLFYDVGQRIVGYLPNLVAGLLLIAVGWFLGWLVKRVVIQLAAIVHLDRLLRAFRWGSGFSKADVRYTLFEMIGNVGFVIVFLIFLNAAFDAMQLATLSDLATRGVLFFPRVLVMLAIMLIGWAVASRVSLAIQKALLKEEVPRSTLIARFAKLVLLLFFSAMAIAELDIAREIVIIGFGTIFVTLGALTVVLAAVGGRGLVAKLIADTDSEAPPRQP